MLLLCLIGLVVQAASSGQQAACISSPISDSGVCRHREPADIHSRVSANDRTEGMVMGSRGNMLLQINSLAGQASKKEMSPQRHSSGDDDDDSFEFGNELNNDKKGNNNDFEFGNGGDLKNRRRRQQTTALPDE